MNTLKQISICMAGALAILAGTSCSSQGDVIEDVTESEALQMHTCKLKLNVSKTSFDATRAEGDEDDTDDTTVWEEGSKILLTFTAGSNTIYGDANYLNGEWTVNYFGSLTSGATAKCQAVYFENEDYISSTVAGMTSGTAIYEDANGSYIYQNGELTVTANLTPKTGRIRFAGAANEEIKVYGINYYSSYDSSTGLYSIKSGMITLKVAANGYTPYVYGEFANAEEPVLNVVTSKSAYTRYFPNTIFKKGESGYVTIPTENNYNRWSNRFIVKVNGVNFNMIPVLYSSTVYLLSETETTEQQYVAVMGGVATTSQKAKVVENVSEWTSFMSNLQSQTGLNFTKTDVSVWQYAYKGGALSKGYTYSGSNNIDDVAWYQGNSDGKVHEVKKLQPNELGFYDMAGNVAELTYYSSNTNYYYGGYFNVVDSSCLFNSSFSSFSSSYSGYRPYFKP